MFTEQADALAEAGVDVLWIETMSSLDEIEAAFRAATTTGLSVVTTMSFDTHGKTMMGVGAAALSQWAAEPGCDAYCHRSQLRHRPDDVVAAVEAMMASGDIARVAKANCGLPRVIDGVLSYPLQPADMPDYSKAALAAGARIIGACCGSVPGHIAAIRAAVA